jgi:hypothetical protein
VIIKRTPGMTREDAAKIAKHFGHIYTSRETSTSFRFRQRPPGDFSSMDSKVINAKVTLVVGTLKKGKK